MSDLRDILLSQIAKTYAILDTRGDKYPYFEKIRELSLVLQKEILYEYSNLNLRKSEEEFLGDLISGYEPFNGGGWLYPDAGGYGVGYFINPYCFRDGAELYYVNDNMFFNLNESDYSKGIAYENMLNLLKGIEAYSSGIGNIYIHSEDEPDGFMFHGEDFDPFHVKSFRFRLDPSKIKDSILIEDGEKIPTSQFGGYFLPIFQDGEYWCELGEIIDGKRVPMLFDDYDIK